MTTDVFPGGKVISNIANAGAVSSYAFNVPARKRWVIMGGYCERDVSATIRVDFYEGANLIITVHSGGAAVTDVSWVPGGTHTNERGGMWVLDYGMSVVYTWGAAQNHPQVSCCVIEIDIGGVAVK